MATHYSGLVVWQLGDAIRSEVFRWTGRSPFSADFKRKSQIEDAADSVCRNISEGFAGTHAVFANYLRIARRSLNEVEDCSRSARLKGYISPSEQQTVLQLVRRLQPAFARLIAYLEHTPDPRRSDARVDAASRQSPDRPQQNKNRSRRS